MIEATATHTIPQLDSQATVEDAKLFLDMDLSILGADENEFDEYEKGVRKEYGHLSDQEWRDGRTKVLKGFLERSWIYHSDVFRGLLESKARENMKMSIARLELEVDCEEGSKLINASQDG